MNIDHKRRAWFANSSRVEPRRFRPHLLVLEDRLAPASLTIELDPVIDQFGNQYEVVQVYRGNDGLGDRVTFGIFDTGASPVTFSWVDQLFFELGDQAIPLLPDVTVEAGGIGGTLSGGVTVPGTIIADGLHAIDLNAYFNGSENAIDLSEAASVDGVQAMMGTDTGSPNLPAIVGTPIMNGRISTSTSDGVAVLIDQYGYELDFGALFPGFGFDGLILQLPDVHFVAPGTNLADLPPVPDTHPPVRLPVELIGLDNHLDPGQNLTESYNPVMTVDFDNGTNAVDNKVMLFDTGAQLSIISTAIAQSLGLDLTQPEFSIGVGGAGGEAGTAINVPGYIIDSLTLPLDNNDGVNELILTGVPIFVLDLGFGLDGILGMNLFNLATHMVYDPNDPDGTGPGGPSVQLTFSTLQREPIDPEELAALNQLQTLTEGLEELLVSLEGEELAEVLGLMQVSGLLLGGIGSAVPSFTTNIAPTVSANQPSVTVNEGQTATNTGTFGDVDGDTVTLTADFGAVTQTGPGTWSWSLATTNGNAGPFLVTITASDGRGGVKTTSFTYTVNNVAPTISLSGAPAIDALTPYDLELGAIVDPGADTVTGYVVHWGDGSSDNGSGSPAGKTYQHTYTAGGVDRTITVDLIDEDGTHAGAGTKTVTVREVAPDLWIKQQVKPARVFRGGVLTFTITVANRGPIGATGVVVDYALPASLSFIRAGSTPGWRKLAARKFQKAISSLEAGQTVKLVFKARVAASLRSGTRLSTTAIVRDDGLNGLDPNPADNRFRITAQVR